MTATDEATRTIDDFLRLIEQARAEDQRDPLRWLVDRLLELRSEVGRG